MSRTLRIPLLATVLSLLAWSATAAAWPASNDAEAVVALDPTDREAHFALATALILGGDYAAARSGLEQALSQHTDDPRIADLLARLLATAPADEVRDGASAVDIASKVLEAFPTPDHAETVAMGLAEMGRFEDAAQLQEQIIDRIRQAEGGRGMEAAQRRLALYREGKPVRAPWLED